MPNMYELTVPVLLSGFRVLSHYLDVATKHVSDKKIDPSVILNARLAPDMLPFTGQVQRASDTAKNGVARLIGATAPAFEDKEVSFEDLKSRIDRTVAYLESVRPEQFESAETRKVELRFRNINGEMTGQESLLRFLLPNYFFHVTTAHSILRNQGIEIGKRDYLGTWED